MRTKPAQPVPTSFPTCGEVLAFVITALDLPAWRDLFLTKTSARDKNRPRRVSDQLRDWATEQDDRPPAWRDFEQFIHEHTSGLPYADELRTILVPSLGQLLQAHVDIIHSEATYLPRAQTRAWYGRNMAPDAICFLYQFRAILRRLPQGRGPMLNARLEDLLTQACTASPNLHPLVATCFVHYASEMPHDGGSTFAESAAVWRSGEQRPSFYSLADCLRGHPRLPEIMLNFAVAHLIESLVLQFADCVAPAELSEARRLLLDQARCLHLVEKVFTEEMLKASHYGLSDYAEYVSQQIRSYRNGVNALICEGEENLLDVRFAELRCYRDYDERFARSVPPSGLQRLVQQLDSLWKATALHHDPETHLPEGGDLHQLRRDFEQWSGALSGPLLAIKARIALRRDESPTGQSLLSAWELYRQAVDDSRYRAGTYTRQVLCEALGLAALMQRRGLAEGTMLLPWINRTLVWWDLVALGDDFDHEQEAQRVERAEHAFTDELHPKLRDRWRAALPILGLHHHGICGLIGAITPEAVTHLAVPVDKRQKRTLASSATGRDQTPLMEAIDRSDLSAARELVKKGADLNFINSTGDSCVTKAFSRGYCDLILEILQRRDKPIYRATLLRVTNKWRHSSLERAIYTGQVDILRELAKWRSGRGDVIDMDVERVNGATPLFYAISCFVGNHNRDGVMECIDYLIYGLHVNLDAPSNSDHSALTYAADQRLLTIANKLVLSGANVNHRFIGGRTALSCAVQNDDLPMAALLIEHGADARLHVDALGRPIHSMNMSDKMRVLIPHRN